MSTKRTKPADAAAVPRTDSDPEPSDSAKRRSPSPAPAPEASIDGLPDEILQKILRYVPWRVARSVCRRWAELGPPHVYAWSEITMALARVAEVSAYAVRMHCLAKLRLGTGGAQPQDYRAVLQRLDERFGTARLQSARALRQALGKEFVIRPLSALACIGGVTVDIDSITARLVYGLKRSPRLTPEVAPRDLWIVYALRANADVHTLDEMVEVLPVLFDPKFSLPTHTVPRYTSAEIDAARAVLVRLAAEPGP
jgi:hypothetical protein